MNIETKDVITLSDNQDYVVCSVIDCNNGKYLYLVDVITPINIKFVKEEKIEGKTFMSVITDEEKIRQLLPLFYEKSKDIIADLES